MQQEIKYNPCGGCGATDPMDRCIGCFHPFYSIETHEVVKWVNLKHFYTEDWDIKHCRFVADKRKLDTDLFEEKNHGLVKKGGTGRVELHEVEYMIESPNEQPVEQKENEPVAFFDWATNRYHQCEITDEWKESGKASQFRYTSIELYKEYQKQNKQ